MSAPSRAAVMSATPWEIGVFTSIDAGLGVSLDVARALNVPTIQLHAPERGTRTREQASRFLARLAEAGIRLTAVFGGFDGESYADIPTVERTVGLAPPGTRQARLAEMKEISDFAALLQCRVVALHLGFVPGEATDDGWTGLVAATRELCRHCQANDQALHLETGQETAATLVRFMDDVDCGNLFVNFDPANMILYGTGEPVGALVHLGSRVRSVHCKDALWSAQPGVTWGREVPLGEGDVNISRYLETLYEIGYRGPLTIEREIPQDPVRQKQEIAHAVELLRRERRRLMGPTY